MNTEQRLMICQYCENRSMDIDTEMVCGLSIKKPDFNSECEFYKPNQDPLRKNIGRKKIHMNVLSQWRVLQ